MNASRHTTTIDRGAQGRTGNAANEQTALLGATATTTTTTISSFYSDAPEEPKPLTALQMATLTVILAGIQFVWTVELGYGTPFLLSLGLSKPLMTLVWMAGPLSGLVIQPVVGRLSDRCQSRLGRRRPYILGGALFVVVSVVAIAYARELARLLAGLLHRSVSSSDGFEARAAMAVAVAGFYVLDFSINASQACARALALDIAPLGQQGLANAYAGRMLSLGSVAGYLVGFLDLPELLPGGMSQMQALCLVAVGVFALTAVVTCVCVRERPLALARADDGGWKDLVAAIWRGITRLPTPVQRVCNVQFLSWMAWFPFLFFATTWVAEIMAGVPGEHPEDPGFPERATRAGSFALFLYAVASLVLSLALPLLVGPRLTVTALWRLSLATMGVLLLSTAWVHTVWAASLVIVLMAFPWAMVLWAPFAMVGEYVALDQGLGGLEGGAVLGIHNMYVVLPQFVINGLSTLVFAFLARSGDDNGDDVAVAPVGVVLRIGGVCALGAVALTWMLFDRRQMRGYIEEQAR
ncbi:hypothetical protein GGI07_002013 [Coemansia sp. Benny D115]|nr:hypothetical protein GGI07_002013 [Coemansia sp. Benny D115]